jgi:glycosyl transferase, family 25
MNNNCLNSIISRVYVINLEHRKDRWNKINYLFKNTGLKLERWNAIYGQDLTDGQMKEKTTSLSYYFCSASLIGCWLSHYSLWEHIVKNKLTNVLILEDDAYPQKNFNQNFCTFWNSSVPQNYDLLYLGCAGSCDHDSPIKKKIIQDSGKMKLITPTFPLLLHAYMLSYSGAQKLIQSHFLKKVIYHIDLTLALLMFRNKTFKVYAVTPALIRQEESPHKSDNAIYDHPLLNSMIGNIKICDQTRLSFINSVKVVAIRSLDYDITLLGLVLIISSFIIGLLIPQKVLKYVIPLIVVYYSCEMMFSAMKKNLLYEMFIVIFVLLIGNKIKNNLKEFTH